MADIATSLSVTDVTEHVNISTPDSSQLLELDGFLHAADAHFDNTYGPLLNVARVETVVGVSGVAWLDHYPVVSVTSAVQGATTLTTGFTFTTAGKLVNADMTSGSWEITYRSGWAALPGDLRLAVLEDIRGLYQRGQLGPPGAMGAFGMEDTSGPVTRPVNMWPRIDEWINRRSLVGIA